MKEHAVLSALGRDKVGIANDLTTALANRSLDIEDSRWTALKGRFTLILQVVGETADLASLKEDLRAFGADLGCHLELEPIEDVRRQGPEPRFTIESFCTGPSGVGAVTGLLKSHEVNIEELETEASAEPWSSRLTFHLKARVTIPPSRSIDAITEELRRLERERNMDIVIEPEPKPVKV